MILNQNERNILSKKLLEIAILYGKEITPEFISMFISSMDNYFKMTLEKYFDALEKYTSDSKNKFFPTPILLREYLDPKLDESDNAKLLSLKINESVSRFGHSNYELAMNYIGPIGKRIVERFGGWNYLCENLGSNIQVGTFIAQSREVIVSMQKEKICFENEQIEYNNDSMKLAKSIIKDLVKI